MFSLVRMVQLARLAHTDPKTGLLNARGFDERLARAFETARRSGRPLSLLFLDLDHFKRLNDTYGHAAGDAVLAALGALIIEHVRKEDVVARFGGEEFVVLLPGVESDEALVLAERLRGTIAAHRFPSGPGASALGLHCTASIGVATYPDDCDSAPRLIERADAAMYRAKQTRNAVARADTGPTLPAVSPTAGRHAAPAAALAVENRHAVSRTALLHAGTWSLAIVASHALLTSLSSLPAGALFGALVFVALGVLGELLRVEVYETDRERISLSFSIAVTMAAVAHQPALAPLAALASSVTYLSTGGRRLGSRKGIAYVASPVVAAWLAGLVYAGAHAQVMALLTGDVASAGLAAHLVATLVAVCVCFGAHVVLISLMTGLYMGRSVAWVARHSVWFGSATILLGSTGAFVGAAHGQLGWHGIFMFAVPVLVMRSKLVFYAEQTRRQIVSLRAAKADVEQAQEDKDDLLRRLVETIASIIDARDNSVSGHSHQVARFAVEVGQELGLDRGQIAALHSAALFHDLGKVAIPEALLHKPDRLSDDEYHRMREHASIGERILMQVPQLRHVARMVGEHHERYDGGGYPRGRAGDQISVGGRILAVVDALESMLANRPYSRGRGLTRALAELDRCAGSHFDPTVVAAVHRVIDRLGAGFFTDAYETPAEGAAERLLAQALGTAVVAAPAAHPAPQPLTEPAPALAAA